MRVEGFKFKIAAGISGVWFPDKITLQNLKRKTVMARHIRRRQLPRPQRRTSSRIEALGELVGCLPARPVDLSVSGRSQRSISCGQLEVGLSWSTILRYSAPRRSESFATEPHCLLTLHASPLILSVSRLHASQLSPSEGGTRMTKADIEAGFQSWYW
jgi:hypothetical protein